MSDRGTVATGPENGTVGAPGATWSDPVAPTGFIEVKAGALIGKPGSARRERASCRR